MNLSQRLRSLDDHVIGPDARPSMGWGEMLRARAASRGRPGGGPSVRQGRIVRLVLDILVYAVLLVGLALDDGGRIYWFVALLVAIAFDIVVWQRGKRRNTRTANGR